MLQLTFLGTSAGVPTKQRNVTALAVECLNPHLAGTKDNNQRHNLDSGSNSDVSSHSNSNYQNKKSRPWVLIDCGEGTQQQLLHTKLSLHQLSAICITHVHGDHCYGLPGLLASAAMSGRTTALTLIAPQAIADLLDAVKLTTELYLPFAINFIAIEELLSAQNSSAAAVVTLNLDKQQQLKIDVVKLSHRVPSHAFGITQTISHRRLDTDKLVAQGIAASALWGKLQQGEDVCTAQGQTLLSADYVHNEELRTRIVVAGDNDTATCLTSAVQDTDLLVHEATYTAEMLAKIQAKVQAKHPDFDPMHSSAQQIGQFAQQVGLNNLILTHFSARYQSYDKPASDKDNMGHIRLDAQSSYHGNLWLAADFAQYRVSGKSLGLASQSDSRVEYIGSALASEGRKY